jgi:hypothetical protein
MCVGGLRPGCRELHTGKLHTQPQRAGQVEAEVFLVADQASGPVVEALAVSLTMGGWRNANGGARAYADGDGAHADAGASRAHAYVN